jgi:hypothetical protein
VSGVIARRLAAAPVVFLESRLGML